MREECVTFAVAPLAGAWIEILNISHVIDHFASLPLRERGLKSNMNGGKHMIDKVAPLAGAWIEIFFGGSNRRSV